MLRRLCCCLLAAAAAAREACLRQWPPRDATPPPLFWMHAPKTGTTFRLHVVGVACPRHRRPRGRRKFEASYVRTLARERTPCAHAYDEASLVEHRSFNTTSCGSGLTLLREPRARLVSAFHYHRDGLPTAGQEKGDSTSLQRECSARAHFGNSTHASRALREMIARPKVS